MAPFSPLVSTRLDVGTGAVARCEGAKPVPLTLLALVGRVAAALLSVAMMMALDGVATPAFSYDSQHRHAPVAVVEADSSAARIEGPPASIAHLRYGYDDTAHPARPNARRQASRYAPNTKPLFSQTNASSTFRHGPFSGQSIGQVAEGVRAGKVSPGDLPIDVVVRNGQTISLNTRSTLALQRGGVNPSNWSILNRTGDPFYERLLSERLARNALSGGTDALRITGAGPYASSLR